MFAAPAEAGGQLPGLMGVSASHRQGTERRTGNHRGTQDVEGEAGEHWEGQRHGMCCTRKMERRAGGSDKPPGHLPLLPSLRPGPGGNAAEHRDRPDRTQNDGARSSPSLVPSPRPQSATILPCSHHPPSLHLASADQLQAHKLGGRRGKIMHLGQCLNTTWPRENSHPVRRGEPGRPQPPGAEAGPRRPQAVGACAPAPGSQGGTDRPGRGHVGAEVCPWARAGRGWGRGAEGGAPPGAAELRVVRQLHPAPSQA